MEWYFASLLMLLTLVGIGLLTGSLLTGWLPARMQPGTRVFLCVPLGWALLTLVATLLGWIGPGYAACHCTAVTAALSTAGAWTGRDWLRRAGGDCLRLAAFCVVASFPVLGPVALHGSFSLYNDTFLYDCQAKWLQYHPFLVAAHLDGGHPAWETVVIFQQTHLRMGAAFLLGWTQAAFGLDGPLDAFPAVAALGLVCGALAVGATVLAACPGRWAEAWLAALAVAVTVNGFCLGATTGFLPQTWGLALFSAAFGLRGLELGTHADRSRGGPWRTGLPLGFLVAAAIHCYWDLLPLAGPSLACTYLLPWPGRSARAWRAVWAQVRAPILIGGLLVNLEIGRAFQGIPYNLHAVVADPVAWPVWHFPAHALGFKSSILERGRWITHDLPVGLLLAGTAVVIVLLGLLAVSQRPERWRHWLRPPPRLARWQWRPLVPALTWTTLTVLLFVYFRYAVPSPWHGQRQGAFPDGTGQSWSQYKVTIWSSSAVIGLVAALGTGWVMRTRSALRRAAWVALLTVWCGAGLGWNFRIAHWRGEQLLGDTGTRRDPLTACLAMRQKVDALPSSDWIYLDWPPDGRGAQLRDLMEYFLCDHPLASDWPKGVTVPPFVMSADPPRGRADCQWVLRYRPPVAGQPDEACTLAGMTLEKTSRR